jgi:hypothetical protein
MKFAVGFMDMYIERDQKKIYDLDDVMCGTQVIMAISTLGLFF